MLSIWSEYQGHVHAVETWVNVADGRVVVTTRHLVGIDATLHNSWQIQLQPKRPDMPQSCSGLALTIPPPLPFVSASIFQSVLSPRQSHLLRSDHPHGLPAERPEAVTGELFWGDLRQGRG